MELPGLLPGAEIARRGRPQSTLVSLPLTLAAAALLWAPAAVAQPVYESVVVAPAPEPDRPREDQTASASVITTERTPRSGESVPQLLSEQPGVTITRYGAHGSLATISLRGSAPNQVAVYVDGVPLASALTGSVDAALLPITGSDRIEIYRGQSPLGFGSSAIGGVVSITSEAPAASGLAAHAGAGSFATRFTGGEATYAGARLTLLGRIALFDSRADFPYRNDGGTLYDPSDDRTLRRQNNRLQQRDGLLRVGLALPARAQLVSALCVLDREQGLPRRGTEPSYRASLANRRLIFSTTYDDRGEPAAGNRLRATAYLLLSEQRLDDPLKEIAFQPTSSRDRSATVGATAVGERRLALGLRLSGMLDGRHESFVPHERLRPELRPPGTRTFAAGGLGAAYHVAGRALDVVASGRLEAAADEVSPSNLYGTTSAATRPARYLLPSARLGLVAAPRPALALRANVGRYARLPSLYERYGNGGLVVGNPALVPERGTNADVGATFTHEGPRHRIVLDGALFAARSADLIAFEDQGYVAGYSNVARARTWGAELSATARALRVLQLFATGTFTDVRDATGFPGRDGRQLPHLPRVRAYARPELRAQPVGPSASVGLYADVDVTAGRFQDGANLVALPTRALFGAGGYLAWRPAGARLLVSAYNLGNSAITDVLEFPLPGRSIFLTLELAYPSSNLAKEIAE